jgi:hypothetical protein
VRVLKPSPTVLRFAAGRLRYGTRGRGVRFVWCRNGVLTQGLQLVIVDAIAIGRVWCIR